MTGEARFIADLTPESAERLDDAALEIVEDQLRLEAELEWEISSRYAGPRLLLLALTLVVLLLLQTIAARLPWAGMGPLGVPVYLALLVTAIFGTRAGWRAAGLTVRQSIRTALHFWPVVLYLCAIWKSIGG